MTRHVALEVVVNNEMRADDEVLKSRCSEWRGKARMRSCATQTRLLVGAFLTSSHSLRRDSLSNNTQQARHLAPAEGPGCPAASAEMAITVTPHQSPMLCKAREIEEMAGKKQSRG